MTKSLVVLIATNSVNTYLNFSLNKKNCESDRDLVIVCDLNKGKFNINFSHAF